MRQLIPRGWGKHEGSGAAIPAVAALVPLPPFPQQPQLTLA